MTAPLFLVDHGALDGLGVDDVVDLTGPEAHHAATVVRLAVGEEVLVADRTGGRVLTTAQDVSGDLVRLRAELKAVNERLWDIEDAVRLKERAQAFDQEFVELARSVYLQNDERARIKIGRSRGLRGGRKLCSGSGPATGPGRRYGLTDAVTAAGSARPSGWRCRCAQSR